ncbi:MAG TPA: hypothetical protein DCQ83_03455, partial [Fibrobacteres bacterium]|nr:hypothetical protein [Fibrobacterota bacterium]
TSANPIFMGTYGTGVIPLIQAQGQTPDALLLQNDSYWIINGLELTNTGATRATTRRTGVHLLSNGGSVLSGIRLRNLYVHDVNGSNVKSNTNEGQGILFESATGTSRFDDLIIENCHLVRTDRNGICQYTSNNTRSTHVVIRNNLLEDIGGDGIKVWGSNGARLEYNVIHGGRMRALDNAAGIWPFASDSTVIQFNEVSGMKGIMDGMAYDADYQCRNSLFQYNYSHDNEGGFLLICAPGNSYSQNTVFRYNISVHDGIDSARIFQLGGKATNTWIYNNTVYVAASQHVPLISDNEWSSGNADSTFFYNNIFYADGNVRYVWNKSTHNFFQNNVFYGNHITPPVDSRGITAKPPLINPGANANGLAAAGAYAFSGASAAFATGVVIANNGGRDYTGNIVPATSPPYVGAIQYGTASGIHFSLSREFLNGFNGKTEPQIRDLRGRKLDESSLNDPMLFFRLKR